MQLTKGLLPWMQSFHRPWRKC